MSTLTEILRETPQRHRRQLLIAIERELKRLFRHDARLGVVALTCNVFNPGATPYSSLNIQLIHMVEQFFLRLSKQKVRVLYFILTTLGGGYTFPGGVYK